MNPALTVRRLHGTMALIMHAVLTVVLMMGCNRETASHVSPPVGGSPAGGAPVATAPVEVPRQQSPAAAGGTAVPTATEGASVPTPAEDPVLATVDGEAIRQSTIDSGLPPDAFGPARIRWHRQKLERLIETRSIGNYLQIS